MKVLTIHQPYAWAITQGFKDVENRTWRTHHRGPLLIHAAARPMDQEGAELVYGLTGAYPEQLAVGALVGVAELTDCVRLYDSPWADPTHWHWVLSHAQPLRHPVKWRGQQGLWDLDGVTPADIACPRCNARARSPCVQPSGAADHRGLHQARHEAAEDLNALIRRAAA